MERAADRNMFGKHATPVAVPSRNQIFRQARTSQPPALTTPLVRKELPALSERKNIDVPKTLYFTNGYMPSLSDLRDAVRNN